MVSFKNIVIEKPDFEQDNISTELHRSGYRTAFIQASDNKYQRVDEFLAYRNFDLVVDQVDTPCDLGTFYFDAEGVGNGKNELCMIDYFTEQMIEGSDGSPFFGMLWTIQTHWPYFVFGKEKDFGVENREFNRYLNSLYQSDAALGRLLDNLNVNELDESTLVVVVGDHGEGFGQHHQFGHSSNIHDENVRVPLIFINPFLFNGENKSVIGGHIDIGPTILDLLRLPIPQKWMGTSLFDHDRNQVAYFFSTWTDYLIGCKTPNHKGVYSAYQNTTKIYNIQQDPFEKKDLSHELPELVKTKLKQPLPLGSKKQKIL